MTIEFDSIMLDLALRNLDSERERFKDIDTKATGIITIMGILMTFVINFAVPVVHDKISIILFILTAFSFLVTIFISVWVIRIRMGPGLITTILINKLENEDTERQIGGIIGTLTKIGDELQSVCNDKAEDLRLAIYALFISIALLILYSLSLIYSNYAYMEFVELLHRLVHIY